MRRCLLTKNVTIVYTDNMYKKINIKVGTNVEIGVELNITDMEGKFLTFKTETQLFAIAIADVVQIVGMQTITEMPDSPHYVKGIINLRGSIISVIDFRLKLGKPEKEYNERTCIIVTNIDSKEIGLVVDEVDSVINIEDENISEPPDKSATTRDSYITGIAQTDKGIVLVMDAAKILSDK